MEATLNLPSPRAENRSAIARRMGRPGFLWAAAGQKKPAALHG